MPLVGLLRFIRHVGAVNTVLKPDCRCSKAVDEAEEVKARRAYCVPLTPQPYNISSSQHDSRHRAQYQGRMRSVQKAIVPQSVAPNTTTDGIAQVSKATRMRLPKTAAALGVGLSRFFRHRLYTRTLVMIASVSRPAHENICGVTKPPKLVKDTLAITVVAVSSLSGWHSSVVYAHNAANAIAAPQVVKIKIATMTAKTMLRFAMR